MLCERPKVWHILINPWFRVMEKGGDLMYIIMSSGTSERSQHGAEPLPQAIQRSHRKKDPKTSHQRAVTKAQENQTPLKGRAIISKTKARPEKEEGRVIQQGEMRSSRSKGKRRKVWRNRKHRRNCKCSKLVRTPFGAQQKNFPFKHSNHRGYILKCKTKK